MKDKQTYLLIGLALAAVFGLLTSCDTLPKKPAVDPRDPDPDAVRQAQSQAWVIDPPEKVCNRCGRTCWIVDPKTEEIEPHLRKAATKTGFEPCR